jgi:release factor glutamine methyltransferase
MKIGQWLSEVVAKLEEAGVGTARLDAMVLLEDVTRVDRTKLLAEPETELTRLQTRQLNNLLKRRMRHEPLAYVRGKTEFYGHEFVITPAVLEPRPESETMIEELLKLPKLPQNVSIADVGTGCGALGITAKLLLPDAQVELLDIDLQALKVAKINVDKFTLDIKARLSDLLANTSLNYDVLLCNLPYVPDDFQINTAAAHEPRLAIFGGKDGLDLYHKLFKQIKGGAKRPLYILSESLPSQHAALEQIAKVYGCKLLSENDFIQVFKCTH